jgi:hypothetical protein
MKKRKLNEDSGYVNTRENDEKQEEEEEEQEQYEDEYFDGDEEMNDDYTPTPTTTTTTETTTSATPVVNPNLSHVQRAIDTMIQLAANKRTSAIEQLIQLNQPILSFYQSTKDTTPAIHTLFAVLSVILSNGEQTEINQLNISHDSTLIERMKQHQEILQQTGECLHLYSCLQKYFIPVIYPELFPEDNEALNGTEFVKYGGQLGHYLFLFIDATYTICKCTAML